MKETDELKEWFLENKRDLPWRRNPTPYEVWVSEVMLQQTQAAVVVPYFERWMERFPTVEKLAVAGIEEVIKLWEGLGYYARARHLHEGAKQVVERFGGKLPQDEEALREIKGLGPYTIGAVLSFAFHKKAAAVDGNVARVMARFLEIKDDICKTKTKMSLQKEVMNFLPDEEPWIAMEALIELGAQVCTKTPKCEECPLQRTCGAYRSRRELELPVKSKAAAVTRLVRLVPLVSYEDEILVRQERGKKVMHGLYHFPYLEEEGDPQEIIRKHFPVQLSFLGELPVVEHTFTRFRARLLPSLWEAKEKREIADYEWIKSEDLSKMPFCSGHREICKYYILKVRLAGEAKKSVSCEK